MPATKGSRIALNTYTNNVKSAAAISQKAICRRKAAAAAAASSSVGGSAFTTTTHMPQPAHEIGCRRSAGQEARYRDEDDARPAEMRRERKFGKHHRRQHDLYRRIRL